MADATRSKGKCDGCAFRKGTDANQEPNNYLKALLCVATPMTFRCHHDQDWQNPDNHGMMSVRKARELGFEVCEGWREEVKKLAATGYYKENSLLTRAQGENALEILEAVLNEKDEEEKTELYRQLNHFVEGIALKKKSFEKL